MSASVSLDTGNGAARCMIQGILDFNTASDVLEKVVPYIADNARLDIDLSGVTQANSAGLALLIEWLATARRADHVVTFHHIPDGLRQLAGVCQVDGLI
ncbi:MAG: lipid asymmetry maintenance protein MlaB [Granulosicoccus sp.]